MIVEQDRRDADNRSHDVLAQVRAYLLSANFDASEEDFGGIRELALQHTAYQRELGVWVAGFLFVDPGTRKLVRLFRDHAGLDLPYVWNRPEGDPEPGFVDELFYRWRDADSLFGPWDGMSFPPEYLVNLPGARGAAPHLTDPIEARHCHYCQLGEVVFYQMAWRYLLRTAQLHGWDAPVGTLSPFAELHAQVDNEVPTLWDKGRWADHSSRERHWLDHVSSKEASTNLAETWAKVMKKAFDNCPAVEGWSHDWSTVGVLRDTERGGTRVAGALLEPFLKFCEATVQLPKARQPATPGRELQATEIAAIESALLTMVRSLFCGASSDATAGTALLSLHQQARFPILPYFYWNVVDPAERTHLVVPLWQSTDEAVKIAHMNPPLATRVVGVAVIGAEPFAGLDHTFPAQAEDRWGRAKSIRRLDRICDYYELLARPVVDRYFYRRLMGRVLEARRREVLATIMARNLSHNLGSHVITHPDLLTTLKLDDVEGGKNLVRLTSYLQFRLDFIAQALAGEEFPPEPLYFVADVLGPFVNQDVLLNLLISDRSFDSSRLGFECRLPGGDVSFEWKDTHFERKGDADLLVGIPGGTLGAHAIHVILENLIRNAAVHSDEHVEKMVIFFDVAERGNVLVLTLSANRDVLTAEKVAEIQKRLADGPITEDGLRRSGGHGIWEMQYCAQFLHPPKGGMDAFAIEDAGRLRLGYRLTLAKPCLFGELRSDQDVPEPLPTLLRVDPDVLKKAQVTTTNVLPFRAFLGRGPRGSRQEGDLEFVEPYVCWLRKAFEVNRWRVTILWDPKDAVPSYSAPSCLSDFLDVVHVKKPHSPEQLDTPEGYGSIVLEHHTPDIDKIELQPGPWVRYSCIDEQSLLASLRQPPQTQLGGAFFLLTLVEAFAARVAIVDERIAIACRDRSGNALLRYRWAGLFPQFFLRVQSLLPNDPDGTPRSCRVVEPSHFDAVVIHESLDPSFEALAGIWKHARLIVRTSGGGTVRNRPSADGAERYPFLPYSVLHAATIGARVSPANKILLARSLFAMKASGLMPL